MVCFSCLAKEAMASSLPTAYFVALNSPFTFWQAKCAQAFLLSVAPFYGLFVDLGSTIKTGTFFLFSDSGFVLTTTCFIGRFFYLTLSSLSG